jgi:hypothetical protein
MVHWTLRHEVFFAVLLPVLLIQLIDALLYISPHEQEIVDEFWVVDPQLAGSAVVHDEYELILAGMSEDDLGILGPND